MRQRERRFVVEGIRLCQEAVRAAAAPDLVFYTAEIWEDERVKPLLDTWREAGTPCVEVSQAVMVACSETETPQGLLAVVPIPDLPRPARSTMTLILDRLRDPGNLGTILRTALAAGVDQVLLAPGTVDATNPKVVRSGMGAHFRLPLAAMDWREIPQAVVGCRVYLASAGGTVPYTGVDWTEPVALIVGGEAAGAGERARDLADAEVTIPLLAEVDSLNAAVATGVLLFEAVRQREAADSGSTSESVDDRTSTRRTGERPALPGE